MEISVKNNKTISRVLGYLFREELDIKHKICNLIMLASAIILAPTTIFTIMIDHSFNGAAIVFSVFVTVVVLLWISNKYPKSPIPFIVLSVIVNEIAFPIMFFKCGGRKSGMVCWFMLGAVLCYLLEERIVAELGGILHIIIFGACLLYEVYNPEAVTYIVDAKTEVIDVIVAFFMTFMVVGAVFKYQTKMYNSEKQKLEENDRELEELNEKLITASRAKSDFLASMSHEIRTPINAVLGMDEMIIRDCKDQEILDYAQDIDSAGRQLLSIINDILDFSKMESGKFEIHEEEYDVIPMINDCYDMIVGKAESKNLAFQVTNNPDIPSKLKGDLVRIKQIIINLMSNAVKYTNEGHVYVRFDFDRVDECNILLKVSVKDTGVGISEEDMPKLFGTFQRINESEHRNVEGTGLGLSISKQLAELMRGSISVESERYVGSTFSLLLPQAIIKEEAAGEFTPGMAVKRSSSGKYKPSFTAETANVLVVDDVKVNLNVVRLLLRDTKIHLDMAETGKDALSLLMDNPYDVVLMDHMMPEMDGVETLKEARKICELNQDTPMIALTANAISGSEEFYMSAGFCEYLTKPIKAIELEESLLKWIPKEKIKKI